MLMMNMRKTLPLLATLVAGFLSASCGGGSETDQPPPPPPPGTSQAPLTLLVRDTPPAGISLLTFELTITGIVLRNSSTGDVPVLGAFPVTVELRNLESSSFLLGNGKVPAGTYTGTSISVSAGRMTVLNNTGASIGTCANDAVCELSPVTAPILLNYSGGPFPLTVQANQPVGLEMDFDLSAVIASDLSVNLTDPNAIRVRSLAPSGGAQAEIEEVLARIVSRTAADRTFVVAVGNTGSSLTLQTDANTRFERFDTLGLPNSFDSLFPFFIVELDYRVLADGTLAAQRVELTDNRQEGEVDGILISTNPFQNFQMVVVEMTTGVPNARVGQKIDVFDPGFTDSYVIDDDGLPVTPDLRFVTGLDFLPGQRVQIRPQAIFPIPPALTARQRLRSTSLTARVKAVTSGFFTVDNLPGLLTGSGVAEVEVRVVPQTRFENVSGIAGLVSGDLVSLRGLLFKGSARPVLLARLVRKR